MKGCARPSKLRPGRFPALASSCAVMPRACAPANCCPHHRRSGCLERPSTSRTTPERRRSMSLLPAPLDDDTGLTSRQMVKARRAQASTELRLFSYALEARTRAEVDRLDSQAIGDASRAALDEAV